MIYYNAEEAFASIYRIIHLHGVDFGNTKCLFNYGFKIQNPMDNKINTPFRRWKLNYVEAEWEWYLSGKLDPKLVIDAGASIWERLKDENGEVVSNYGYWWNINNQLKNVINLLKKDKYTRRAVITLLDGKLVKDIGNELDVMCTYGINFFILDDKLNMNVMMRSNDLWFGFCNDQYCFSNLQKKVADAIDIKVGYYYHFVNNLHLYNKFLNRN